MIPILFVLTYQSHQEVVPYYDTPLHSLLLPLKVPILSFYMQFTKFTAHKEQFYDGVSKHGMSRLLRNEDLIQQANKFNLTILSLQVV